MTTNANKAVSTRTAADTFTMEKKGGRPVYKQTWHDFAQFVDDIESIPQAPEAANSSNRDPDNKWSGGASWEESLELARYGWDAGTKQFVQGMAINPPTAAGVAPSRRIGVAGHSPHIPNAIVGAPNSMVARGEDHKGGRPIARFLVGMTFSSGVKPQFITNRGIAICSAIDELESNGVSCELEVHCATQGYGGGNVETRVMLKHAGEPLNVARMAYVLAHAGFLRRSIFRAWEILPVWENGILDGSYGRPGDVKAEDSQLFFPGGRLHGGTSDGYSTIESASEKVAKIVNEGLEREWSGKGYSLTDG